MGDVNNQIIKGSVTEVNGIKIEKAYFNHNEPNEENIRSKYLKEILYYRHHCRELHIILCRYTKEVFKIKGSFKFTDLSTEQLEKVYQFSLPLRKVIFVYRSKMEDKPYKLAFRIAYAIHKLKRLFIK
ncbi:hypothetical protein E4T80_12165 [Muribacter muris]|uniref:Uncharacterized protein n=1 Tax=Muribacter muris TaxID=67855 RepID=A0A4Y9JS92_9PAST|nr:hypothetical protein [Muribacter muris]MBF0786218.1 hypothetical protein [Muribacter muris]MBF0826449.1 hypothetical protein [Muribacter muris]TFV07580.1 hypothetical protein E4T80_12165 [Muribacter muris]